MNNVKQSHSIDLAKTSSSSANSNRETSSVASLAMPFLNTTTSSITQGLHHPIYTHPPIAVSQVFVFKLICPSFWTAILNFNLILRRVIAPVVWVTAILLPSPLKRTLRMKEAYQIVRMKNGATPTLVHRRPTQRQSKLSYRHLPQRRHFVITSSITNCRRILLRFNCLFWYLQLTCLGVRA